MQHELQLVSTYPHDRGQHKLHMSFLSHLARDRFGKDAVRAPSMTAPMDSSFPLEPRLTEVGICAFGNNNAEGVKHDWKEYVRSLTYEFCSCLRYWGRHNWKILEASLEAFGT